MLTYAIDFDGTLCTDAWPDIGEPISDTINFCKARKAEGHKLIFWSCREGEMMARAIVWCADRGIHFDSINANLPEFVAKYGGDCRKVFADYYLDDRNILMQMGGKPPSLSSREAE